MQDSMMIAEVGDMENVSGSRMATPLAPPSPGSTPMITPSRMPITISTMLKGWRTTANPWNRLTISSILDPNVLSRRPAPCEPCRSKPQQVLDRPLRQRNQEPLLEHHVGDHGYAQCDRQGEPPAVTAEPFHEHGDQERRGQVNSGPWNDHDIDRRRDDDRQDLAELAPVGEQLVALSLDQRAGKVGAARSDDQHAEIERKEPGFRPFGAPADADLHAPHDDDHAEQRHEQCDARLHPAVEGPAGLRWCLRHRSSKARGDTAAGSNAGGADNAGISCWRRGSPPPSSASGGVFPRFRPTS